MFEIKYCKEIMQKHFKKELVMREENQRHFRKADKCHICNKLYSGKRY